MILIKQTVGKVKSVKLSFIVAVMLLCTTASYSNSIGKLKEAVPEALKIFDEYESAQSYYFERGGEFVSITNGDFKLKLPNNSKWWTYAETVTDNYAMLVATAKSGSMGKHSGKEIAVRVNSICGDGCYLDKSDRVTTIPKELIDKLNKEDSKKLSEYVIIPSENNNVGVNDIFGAFGIFGAFRGLIQWIVWSAIISLFVGIAIFFTFLPNRNEKKLNGSLRWLHKYLNFNVLIIETLPRMAYTICALFITFISFISFFFTNFIGDYAIVAFLLIIIVGNLLLRVAYESFMIIFIICRNTSLMREKLYEVQPDEVQNALK
jgi:hypothetical protein